VNRFYRVNAMTCYLIAFACLALATGLDHARIAITAVFVFAWLGIDALLSGLRITVTALLLKFRWR
jgi:hypothetical protein